MGLFRIRTVALVAAPVLLLGQSDPLRLCRLEASISTDAVLADVEASAREGVIVWNTQVGSRFYSGYCEADSAGRIVRFERSPHAVGTAAADPPPHAIEDCRRHVALAIGLSPDDIGTWIDHELIAWRAQPPGHEAGGVCEPDPKSGRIVRFEINSASENRLEPDEAETTCRRAARWRLGAADGEVEAQFESAGPETYRVLWRYDSETGAVKTGWCAIDFTTGRIRRLEVTDDW